MRAMAAENQSGNRASGEKSKAQRKKMINSAALIGQPASVPLQLLRLPRTRLKVGRHSGCLCVRVACLVWPPSRLVRACAAPTVHKSATNGESFSTVDIKLVRGSPFPSTCVACKTSLSTWHRMACGSARKSQRAGATGLPGCVFFLFLLFFQPALLQESMLGILFIPAKVWLLVDKSDMESF